MDDTPQPHGKTILVVDDDEEARYALAEVLRDEGYEVLEAGTGPDGLQLTIGKHPDLIMLDWFLPGMQGDLFMQRFHELRLPRRPPVIVVTATRDDPGLRAAKVEAAGLITKPWRMGEVIQKAHAYLDDKGA